MGGMVHPGTEYEHALRSQAGKPWYRSFGGESLADLCLRLRVFLEILQHEATGLKVLVVCAGHVLQAFRVLLEDLKGEEMAAVLAENIPFGHIRWYSRQESAAKIHNQVFKVTCLNMEEPENIARTDAVCVRTDRVIPKKLLTLEQLRERA